jgi:tRNA nucleotidyltransferase/poly(A) polymerase
MPLTKDIIDRTLATKHGEAAYKVVESMIDAGYECFWIGGAVRDMLLGKVPNEIDIAASALPADIERLFKKSDASAAELGTIIVSLGGQTFEITTFREDDSASDGRHPESVQFTKDKKKDAIRRDATINAMYWNPVTGDLIDPCEGEKDLKEKLVRFIGNADERIKHDALRILRMIRLRALIQGQYHPETYKALGKNAKLVSILSGTRVLEELEKLLKVSKPSIGLEDWLELGILKELLGEVHACKGVAQPAQYHKEGDVWEHLKACADAFTEDHSADVRLAGFFHDIGKAETFSVKERIRFDHHAEASAVIVEKIFQRFQMPVARIKKIQWIIEHHMMMNVFQKLSDVRKAHWYFHPWFQELLQLFWIDIQGTSPGDTTLYDAIIKDYNEFLNAHPRPAKPLLSGDDIMQLAGLKPGEEVGKAIQALKDAQISEKITTKAEAKEFLKKILGKP